MKILRHLPIPIVLIVLLVSWRFLIYHDSGVIQGMILLLKDGIRSLVSLGVDLLHALGYPKTKPLPEDWETITSVPCDSFLLLSALTTFVVCLTQELWRRWFRRKST